VCLAGITLINPNVINYFSNLFNINFITGLPVLIKGFKRPVNTGAKTLGRGLGVGILNVF